MTVLSFAEASIKQAIEEVHREFEKIRLAKHRLYNSRLKVGEMLIALRKRVEAGEAGDITWWDWYARKINRSRKDGEKCMRMAQAEDPDEAVEDEREEARQRMQKRRGANVRSKKSDQANTSDLIERAIELVTEMTATQRRRFVAKLKELRLWE